MTIRPGDFWVANIPFTDGSASKKRPVLVLWLDGRDAISALSDLACNLGNRKGLPLHLVVCRGNPSRLPGLYIGAIPRGCPVY